MLNKTLSVVSVLIFVVVSLGVNAATPLGTELTNSQRLKISRLNAKNMQTVDLDSYVRLDDARDGAFEENNSECGNIEIGNIKGGQIGAPPPKVDIIITEDIINVPGNC